MADNATAFHGNKSDDSGYTRSLQSPSDFTGFEIKTEPCSTITTWTDNVSPFDEASTLHIPMSALTMKNPIILLERCDKIWETLQLIRTVQPKPTSVGDDYKEEEYEEEEEKEKEEEEEEEEAQHSNIAAQSSYIKNQSTLENGNTAIPPFKFSVKSTRKLYPCLTCGKQYLERRSLRKHSEKIHGVTLPLLTKPRRVKRKLQALDKNDFNEVSLANLLSKENSNSEKLYNDKDSFGKITAKAKLISTKTIVQQSTELKQFIRCTLCLRKVNSIREHLTNYHKIGDSSIMMEELESSVLIKNKTSSADKKTALKNILSGKPPQISTNENMQGRSRIMNNEDYIPETTQGKRKQKYTSSYGNCNKRFKSNIKRRAFAEKTTIKEKSLNLTSFKCDICLGIYSSARGLYKHKRIHLVRGETKENFHNFTCRYFNSPFNKKYKASESFVKLANAAITNTSYNMDVNSNETTCPCGRSFRNPHTLFLHKVQCKIGRQEDEMAQYTTTSSDEDTGFGINIKIKKRNDSYEIVSKDNKEDKFQKSKEDTSTNVSISKTSDRTAEDFINTSTKQQELNIPDSKYSKDHSILKLKITDEDVIIDIEDEQVDFNKTDVTNELVTQKNDERCISKPDNNAENVKYEKIFNVRTLKRMCQEVLDGIAKRKLETVEDNSKENSQVESQKNKQATGQKDNQVKSKEMHQENKRELRSSSQRRRTTRNDFDYSNDEKQVDTMNFNLLPECGYCNKQFSTISLYDDHNCTVIQGKPFDNFSLHLQCFYCKDILNDYPIFDQHVKVKHFDNAYHCYQCTMRFTTDKARLNHFHAEHNHLSCRFCNKKLSITVKALHEGYHLGFGYPCHKCKKAYTNKKNLSYHKYTIHPNGADNLITCNICLRSVKLKTFRRHMHTHKHNECHFCGKVFSNRTGIEYHTMIHHNTQFQLKSNANSKRFFNEKQFEKHKKING